jgi:hypothetical protein
MPIGHLFQTLFMETAGDADLGARSSLLLSYCYRVARLVSNCARPNQDLSIPPLLLSKGEWPRLPSTARIGRAQFHRARSASKEGTWPLPPDPSEPARCTSKRAYRVTPPPSSAASCFLLAPPASTGRSASLRHCPIPLPRTVPDAASCPAHCLRH